MGFNFIINQSLYKLKKFIYFLFYNSLFLAITFLFYIFFFFLVLYRLNNNFFYFYIKYFFFWFILIT